MHTCCDEEKPSGGWKLLVLVMAILAVVGVFVISSWGKKAEPPVPQPRQGEESLNVHPDSGGSVLLATDGTGDIKRFSQPTEKVRDPSRTVFRPKPDTNSSDLIRKLPVDQKAKPQVEKLNQ